MRGTDVTDFKRVYRTAAAGSFAEVLEVKLELEERLRYGENPNQCAALYHVSGIDPA